MSFRAKIVRILCLFFAACAFTFTCSSFSLAADKIAIVYPQYSAPYNSIFSTIISGIAASGLNIVEIPTDPSEKTHIDPLGADIKGVIALGYQGIDAIENVKNLPVVVGAVPWVPKTYSGVSLSASPDATFRKVRKLFPKVEKVHVVSSDNGCCDLIEKAKNAAEKYNFHLESYKSASISGSLLQYKTILEIINPDTDIIWLPLDPLTANDNTVLPLLLKESWNRNLKIVSSKPSHARSGILLATFPDNFSHGRQIGEVLKKVQKNKHNRRAELSKDIKTAINSRTSSHLGLGIGFNDLNNYDLVFPAR